ncbi:MAG: hypothetical protein GF400_10845, partial [Candidatus Eisenbacteria bacterium]|nr:hypothetical protein [Candidatus Eisenbacteria bacterium]
MGTPPRGRIPAALAASALAAGILLGAESPLARVPFQALCAAACVLAGTSAVNLLYARTRRRPGGLSTDALLLCALAVAAASFYRARHELTPPSDVCLLAPRESLALRLRVSESRATSRGRSRAVAKAVAAGSGR